MTTATIKKTAISAAMVAVLILSFHYDQAILGFVRQIRFELLNNFMLFITKDGLIMIIAILGGYLLFKKKYAELILIIITATCSLETAFILKKIFQIPRPFSTPEFEQMALKLTTGFSFPSMHAAFCMGVIPFIKKIFNSKIAPPIFITLFLTVVISRTYIGLHYFSDIMAGGLIGYLSGTFWRDQNEKKHIANRLIRQFKENLELRRQIAHAITGIVLIFLVVMGVVDAVTLAVVLVAGLAGVVIIKNYRIPVVSKILEFFEREKDLRLFPGKGPFFFILGSFLALLFFRRDIALASIAVMAIGDAAATVTGYYFGKYKNPFNPLKHLEGTFLAIILSTVAAFTFVPFNLAFLGSIVGIIFESLTIKFLDRVLDDNLLIPIIAGIVMTALA
jgi:undecaprenyl-diphosphatase